MANRPGTNSLIFVIICITLALLTQLWANLERRPALDSKTMPNVSLTDFDGKMHQLHTYKGRTVVLHFWATWCAPCIQEMPALVEKAKASPQAVFILVSEDADKKTAEDFLKNYKFGANAILTYDKDAELARHIFRLKGLPETFLIAPDMTLTRHIIGPLPWVSFSGL